MTKGEYVRRRGRLLKRLREERKHKGWEDQLSRLLGRPVFSRDVLKAQNSLCYIRHQYYAES